MEEAEENFDTVDPLKDDEGHLQVLEISLHALSSVTTPKSMRVTGVIHGRKLHILIDSGNTHNFVSLKFARRMDCCKAPTLAFQVMMANGDRL